MTPGHVNDPVAWQLLLGNIYFALVWLPMRFFLGRDWFSSGSHKLVDPAWMNGGEALKNIWQKQVVVPQRGQPPITYAWFRHFLQYMLDHGWYSWFGKLIAAGATEALNGRVVFALARFLPGWSLDHSFGRDGAVATRFGDGSVAYASALQPDGKVVAAGTTGSGDLAAAKLPSSPWRVIYLIGVWTAASESAES
jgi:hypothetical protein